LNFAISNLKSDIRQLSFKTVPINPKSKIQNPKSLWLVRHGESTANVARHLAEAARAPTIDFPEREPDVPLSNEGVRQSLALGEWFAFETEKPTVVFSSPYLRSRETARLIAERARLETGGIFCDERIRERELGIFDRLTKFGALEKYPEVKTGPTSRSASALSGATCAIISPGKKF
jgi:broad specificity phosphatase PhoE